MLDQPEREHAVHPIDNADQSPHEDVALTDLILVFGVMMGKKKKLIFGLPLVCAVIAAAYSLVVPYSFTSSTTFLPPQQHQTLTSGALQQLGGLAGLASGLATGLRRPEDLYFAMLRSERLQDALIDRFGLMGRYQAQYRQNARDALTGNAIITVERGGLLKVEVTDKDPTFAAQLANGHVEELRKLLAGLAVTEPQQRRAFLEQQLLNAKDALVKAEIALKRTQERTGLIALDKQGEAIIRAAADLRAQVAVREVQLRAMRNYATPQNSDVQRLESEIAGYKAQLMKMQDGDIRRGDVIVPTGKVPEAGLEYIRAVREVKYGETVFELLARQFELAKVDEAREGPLVQQVDVALPAEFRSGPKRKQMVLTAALFGGLLAIAFVMLSAALRNARNNPARRAQLQELSNTWRIRPRR